MWSSVLLVLALVVIKNVNGQMIKCKIAMEESPDNCCKGVLGILNEDARKACMIDVAKRGNSDCAVFTCLMKKYNMLTPDGKINKKPTFEGKLIPEEFKEVTKAAVLKCIEEVEKDPTDCEPAKFALCYARYLFINCPANLWNATPKCMESKTSLENCKVIV